MKYFVLIPKKIILSTLCILLFSSYSFAYNPNKISFLTENHPPLNMSIEDKNFARGESIDGISADLIREMSKRANINYSLTLRFPWQRIYNLSLKNKNIGIFSTSRTPERESLFHWVGPLINEEWSIYSKVDSTININSLDDLKKYTVGGYAGDSYSAWLEKMGIRVTTSLKDITNAEKLDNGDIDLWAVGEFAGPYFAEQKDISMKQSYKIRNADAGYKFYLAINLETEKRIVDALQKALDDMKRDGTYQEIVKSYF